MLGKAFHRCTEESCLIRLALVFALAFATWHVASHGLDTSSDADGHAECQVCRLSHVPIADLPVLTWIVLLFKISLVFVIPALQRTTQSYRYSLGARAPPLF
jgi:hypothetical protein